MNLLRKKMLIFLVLLFSLFSLGEAQAESDQNYQSTGEVSFYGTYEYPDTDEKEEKDSDFSDIPNNGKNRPRVEGILPQTGEHSTKQLLPIGVLIFLSTCIMYKKINKKIWRKQ